MPPPASTPSPRLTHFLCLPLVTSTSRPQLQTSLRDFQLAIADRSTPENPDGIPARAIRPVGTLHLTLGVMSLLTVERVDGAVRCLRGLDLRRLWWESCAGGRAGGSRSHVEGTRKGRSEEVQEEDSKEYQEEHGGGVELTMPKNLNSKDSTTSKPAPSSPGQRQGQEATEGELKVQKEVQIRITLRGLTSMHAPSATSILYSSPIAPAMDNNDTSSLQTFCQSLRDAFARADFIVAEQDRPLLLHATILNTVYVPGVRGGGGGGGRGGRGRGRGGRGGGEGHGKHRARLTINATEILEDWAEREWMTDVRIEKVAICRMGARRTREGDEEEYVVEAEVDLP